MLLRLLCHVAGGLGFDVVGFADVRCTLCRARIRPPQPPQGEEAATRPEIAIRRWVGDVEDALGGHVCDIEIGARP
jgi:hypothetical protein